MSKVRELPELELTCMRLLWNAGDRTVHDVRNAIVTRGSWHIPR